MTERVRSLLGRGLPTLSVGILTADLLRLGEELDTLDAAGIELVHVDVMDGVFCPQMTVGPPLVRALPDRFLKDVHLMVDEPLAKAQAYVEAGANLLTFHVEATRHPHRLLQSLANCEVIRGVALNPGTPVTTVAPLLDDLELILLLAVNPGFSGQTFIPATTERLNQVQQLTAGSDILVAIDGGVTRGNIEQVGALGADIVIAGSAVFDGTSPAENARAMRTALRARSPGEVTAGVGEN